MIKPNQSNKVSKIRILSGTFKSRNIIFPIQNNFLRPTLNIVRETLFNWLAPHIKKSNCLDAFAGSGALGIESLSRLANYCTFIENNNLAIKFLKINIEKLSIQYTSNLIYGDSLKYLSQKLMKNFNIIFLDPPFFTNTMEQSLDIILQNKLINKKCIIYIEYLKKNKPSNINDFKIVKSSTINDIFFGIICKK